MTPKRPWIMPLLRRSWRLRPPAQPQQVERVPIRVLPPNEGRSKYAPQEYRPYRREEGEAGGGD